MSQARLNFKAINFKAIFALVILCFGARVHVAQQQVGIPVKIKEGFVLEFNAPYDRLILDTGETNFTTNETTEVTIGPKTVFLNRKNAPADKSLIRPGVKVEVEGERLGTRVTASSVKIKIDVESWSVEVGGYFEKLEGDRARIDGQTVVLAPGAIILGDKEWQGKTFKSFNEMMLGSRVEVKGVRKADGIVYATEGKTKPNLQTDNDRRLIKAVREGLVLPGPNQLSGGQIKVGNREFKLVENLDVQAYVTMVGYKLVPRYIKELPNDDPAKMTFRFYVIEDDSFNAFALPDGSVFIHTGLLKALKNEAQLAAVLGHEISHVTYEHARRTQERVAPKVIAIGSIFASAMTGKDYIALFGTFGAGVLSNKFGREYEDEADRVGLFYMYDAGYDPREAPKVWREIAKRTKEDKVSNFLYSDHSSAQARLRNLNQEIAYNYYDTDFTQTISGEEKYARVVGGYFNWIPVPQAPQPSTPVNARQTPVSAPPTDSSALSGASAPSTTTKPATAAPPPVQEQPRSSSTLFGNPPTNRKKKDDSKQGSSTKRP